MPASVTASENCGTPAQAGRLGEWQKICEILPRGNTRMAGLSESWVWIHSWSWIALWCEFSVFPFSLH